MKPGLFMNFNTEFHHYMKCGYSAGKIHLCSQNSFIKSVGHLSKHQTGCNEMRIFLSPSVSQGESLISIGFWYCPHCGETGIDHDPISHWHSFLFWLLE